MKNNLSEILEIFVELIISPMILLSYLAPKRRDVWIFGSWRGSVFSDNSRYLFEYVSQRKPHICAVWITKNRALRNSLRKRGFRSESTYSVKGVFYGIRAKVAVMSAAYSDIGLVALFFSRKTILVQLWHGTPLKKIDLNVGNLWFRVFRRILLIFLGREYDIIVSATDKNTRVYSNIFNIKEKRVLTLGQPRNDLLLSGGKGEPISSARFHKVILYAPTWRSYDLDLFSDFGFDFHKVQNFLQERNILMVLKIHINEIRKYSNLANFKNISLCSDSDIYPYLKNVDILLTDYSSLYFDFLLLDRPVVFTAFDYKKYSRNPGFYYDYEKVTPGPKTLNWSETFEKIEDILNGSDAFAQKRKEIASMYNQYQDNGSSQRIYEELASRLDI